MFTAEQILDETEDFIKSGHLQRAEFGARRVLREQPTNTRAMSLLANTILGYGDRQEALRLFTDAIFNGSTLSGPYMFVANDFLRIGKLQEVAGVYRKWVEADPESPSAKHMLATTMGTDAPTRCSTEYVCELFDAFAPTFDFVLQGLAYRAPEAVAAALERWRRNEGATLDVLDAGCGTGLCGAAVKQHCRRLVGVDLAAQMIRRARERGCYDDLVQSDLEAFLTTSVSAFDVILSSDVLIYFGDLRNFIVRAHHALKRSGLLIVTVEALISESSVPYILTPAGRYAHQSSYLRSVLLEHGFRIRSMQTEPLRYEHGKEVIGHIVVAQKKGPRAILRRIRELAGFGSFDVESS